MFACLYSSSAPQAALIALASSFSPLVEDTAPGIVVFSIVGLSKLIGTVEQIASAIARTGAEARIQANLAIAADPDAARIAARHISGLTMIPLGREADRLSGLPLHVLGDFMADEELRILDTLDRWGIHTLGELAALPELGFIARFGDAGERLLRLARGEMRRALRVREAPEIYERRMELDHPLALLEPLLLVVSSMLGELMEALGRQGLATNRVTLGLRLAGRRHTSQQDPSKDPEGERGEGISGQDQQVNQRILEFPVPVRDPQVILKQLQFDLEAQPPPAAILGVQIRLNPVEPRALQHGLFIPQAPAPEKLSLTLARLTALVGEGNAGSPELLDTHRPDAFRMRAFSPEKEDTKKKEDVPGYFEDGVSKLQPAAGKPSSEDRRSGSAPMGLRNAGVRNAGLGNASSSFAFRFAFRYARPAPRAEVRLKAERPVLVRFHTPLVPAQLHTSVIPQPASLVSQPGMREVLAAAGPWKASGDWWSASPWDREEWDVELSDGGLYRIYYLNPQRYLNPQKYLNPQREERIENPVSRVAVPRLLNADPRQFSHEWFLEGVYD